MRLFHLHPRTLQGRRPQLEQEVQPVLRDARQGLPVQHLRAQGVARVAEVRVRPCGDEIQAGRDLELGAELHPTVAGPTGVLVEDARSEEHTSELQSHSDLVCRLLLEKKKKQYYTWGGSRAVRAQTGVRS